MKKTILLAVQAMCCTVLLAQAAGWQQRVVYSMDINMDVSTNRFTGTQKLVYTNNSPDTLHKVFYHLYFNAFQPNSMMDIKNRESGKLVLGKDIEGNDVFDWEDRIADKIMLLKPGEIGYQHILSLKMNGVEQNFKVLETILEVNLSKPVLPKSQVVFDMTFEAQVPLQIRRSGRDSPSTGVRYSMGQWYPKLCEYDKEGWHPTPYVAREFYGVWGNYDVRITIDKNYILGATGVLENASEVGYGYQPAGTKVARPSGNKLTWHFSAANVHDFVWGADPHYEHITRKAAKGTAIHVLFNADETRLRQQFDTMGTQVRSLYKNDFKTFVESWRSQWVQVADAAVTVLPFMEKHFGEYPYAQYSFIHGGDGGTEYPMATLMNRASVGLAFHEWMHSWYQMMLGTNESLYPWMDEGFADYAGGLIKEFYRNQTSGSPVPANGVKSQDADPAMEPHIHQDAYKSYFTIVRSGYEEPLSTHADHYTTNYAYNAVYSKGAVFLEQLGYITGADARDKILLEYYRLWRFKHPDATDFMNIAEKVSGMKLDWYRDYWINTTKIINYAIDSLWEAGGKTMVRIRNKGQMPMPVDVQVKLRDGSNELHYIPLNLMFGQKPIEFPGLHRIVHEEWKWVAPVYVFEINRKRSELSAIEIDPTQRMADVNRRDNRAGF